MPAELWRGASGPQRLLIVTGLALVASGLFHSAVYLAQGAGSLSGPVTWRKPIEFGISGGLMALSLAAVLGRLPRTGWLAWPIAIGASFFVPETALITMQQWRGVPSHFNFATNFDAAVFALMGFFIAVVSLAIVVITVWTFTSLRGPASSAVAIRAGMVLLTVGQVLGFAIIGNGTAVDDLSRASIFGVAGELKIPHGVALHGLQVLGVLALLLDRSMLAEPRRLALAVLATAGYALALAASIIHTLDGRAPLELTPISLGGSIVALAMVAVAYLAALRAAPSLAVGRSVPAN
jgi:hypothetical protein